MTSMPTTTSLRCACGQFHLSVTGEPFITAECHCTSCRSASQRLSALPVALPMTAANGGTPYVLYRKDRVAFPDGTAALAAFRLTDASHTRRLVTTCCKTPIGVEFEGGHWLSLYAGLWSEADRPAMQIRTQTGDVPTGTVLDDSLPAGGGVTAGFYAKLLWAWIAMGFKVPKVDVTETINA
jgi:hypothetical protein